MTDKWIITFPLEHEKEIFKHTQADPEYIRIITNIETQERHIILMDPEKSIMGIAGNQRLNNGG